jgi:hypothetical protein
MSTDSEAVKLWRDFARLNLSQSWKADIDKTVTDIELWREILANWHYYKNGRKIKKSPGIKNLLTEYERREFNRDAIQQERDRVHCQESVPERRDRMVQQQVMPALLAKSRF